jgi:hypothetical protein
MRDIWTLAPTGRPHNSLKNAEKLRLQAIYSLGRGLSTVLQSHKDVQNVELPRPHKPPPFHIPPSCSREARNQLLHLGTTTPSLHFNSRSGANHDLSFAVQSEFVGSRG